MDSDSESLDTNDIQFCHVEINEEHSSLDIDNANDTDRLHLPELSKEKAETRSDTFSAECTEEIDNSSRGDVEKACKTNHIFSDIKEEDNDCVPETLGKSEEKQDVEASQAEPLIIAPDVCLYLEKEENTSEVQVSPGNLNSPSLTEHEKGVKLKCTECEYRTTKPSAFRIHARVHTGERPYKCEQCDYSGSTLSKLKTHMIRHTGDRPFKCRYCDYLGSTSSAVKRHVVTMHTDERMHKCTECGFSTKASWTLKLHIRSHTGEKPYKCTQCDYRATNLGSLRLHIRTHMTVKPFQCSECTSSFVTSTKLNNHFTSVHRKKK